MNQTHRRPAALARIHDPREVLDAVTRRFDALAVATSLGPQTLVVLDMLHRLGRRVPVFFLDTGLLFPETYALRIRIQHRYGLDVRSVRPARTVDEQAAHEGDALWTRDPDRCCRLRKVDPLTGILEGLDAWVTGLRRDQSATRAHVETVMWDDVHDLWKVSPLAHWSRAQVFGYLHEHDVPYNPLLTQGYPSVGCTPCTRPITPEDLEDGERAGRWSGHAKTECGLHVSRRGG